MKQVKPDMGSGAWLALATGLRPGDGEGPSLAPGLGLGEGDPLPLAPALTAGDAEPEGAGLPLPDGLPPGRDASQPGARRYGSPGRRSRSPSPGKTSVPRSDRGDHTS